MTGEGFLLAAGCKIKKKHKKTHYDGKDKAMRSKDAAGTKAHRSKHFSQSFTVQKRKDGMQKEVQDWVS